MYIYTSEKHLIRFQQVEGWPIRLGGKGNCLGRGGIIMFQAGLGVKYKYIILYYYVNAATIH